MRKADLIQAISDQRGKMLDELESLSDEHMLESGAAGYWSVKDILHHLTMWEAELVKTLFHAHQGTQPVTELFNENCDPINLAWYQTGKDRPLERVMMDFDGVRLQTLRRLNELSDAELNNAQRYPWMNGHSLSWLVEGVCIEHEAFHVHDIQDWRKKTNV